MKGWVVSLVAGVVLGSAVAGAAQSAAQSGAWQSAKDILSGTSNSAQLFRLGYAEGIADTLTMLELVRTVMGATPEVSQNTIELLHKDTVCLRIHQQGTASDYGRWAEGVWQSGVDRGDGIKNAASILVAGACR
jgi:hypothetical protein